MAKIPIIGGARAAAQATLSQALQLAHAARQVAAKELLVLVRQDKEAMLAARACAKTLDEIAAAKPGMPRQVISTSG